MRYQVRCCCRPDRLLGHIEAPEGIPVGGEFAWPPKVRASGPAPWQVEPTAMADDTLVMQLCWWFDGPVEGVAFKADGVAIERLVEQPEFEPLTKEESDADQAERYRRHRRRDPFRDRRHG